VIMRAFPYTPCQQQIWCIEHNHHIDE
jgi:hypothetical protein